MSAGAGPRSALGRIRATVSRADERLALAATAGFGTMAATWASLAWALLPIAFHALQPVVFYVSSGVVQLVALPLLMVGQNLQGEVTERRDRETHDAVMEELAEVRAIVAALHLHVTGAAP